MGEGEERAALNDASGRAGRETHLRGQLIEAEHGTVLDLGTESLESVYVGVRAFKQRSVGLYEVFQRFQAAPKQVRERDRHDMRIHTFGSVFVPSF